jgi:hypothetical protein
MGYLLLSKDFPPGDTPYSYLKPNFNTKCYSLVGIDTVGDILKAAHHLVRTFIRDYLSANPL